MMRTAHTRARIASWLSDTYLMERDMAPVLDRHAEQAWALPALQQRLIRHADETRRHAEMVWDALDRYDARPSPRVPPAHPATLSPSGHPRPDDGPPVRNLLTDIAAEHFEIAAYHAMEAAAHATGDDTTARMCARILRDEEQMAAFLKDQLARVTQRELAEMALS